jgi:hypothetical protein
MNIVHRIRYHEQTDLNDTYHLAGSSHFHQSLDHWPALNFSEAYGKLFKRLHPLASSLEQVVYNRDRIFEIVREAFHERNPLILETLLDLVVPLARDLQGDFYFFYKQSLFEDIVNLLLRSKQEQNEINMQLLEQSFNALPICSNTCGVSCSKIWRVFTSCTPSSCSLRRRRIRPPCSPISYGRSRTNWKV